MDKYLIFASLLWIALGGIRLLSANELKFELDEAGRLIEIRFPDGTIHTRQLSFPKILGMG